jgi:hypothetical protein
MDPHHVHPRVNGVAGVFRAPAKIVKEQWLKFVPAFPRLLLKGIVHQVRGISSKVCEKVSRAILRGRLPMYRFSCGLREEFS